MRAHERGPLDDTGAGAPWNIFLLQFLAAGRADETRLTEKYVYRQNFQKSTRDDNSDMADVIQRRTAILIGCENSTRCF